MAVPVLLAIAGTVANIIVILREFRKVVSFVIAAAIWAAFLWLFGLLLSRADTLLSEVDTASQGASASVLTGFLTWFDKVEWVWPVYTCLNALGLYLSVVLGSLLVRWLLRSWAAVPFKGGSGT